MNYYRELLTQTERVEPFRRALNALVGPDDRVLEVGAGVGTYSFFAADAGAVRVFAVEGAPVIHVAESIARVNGYGKRVEFLRGWVPDVAIPERASVLIFEDFPSRLIDAATYRLIGKLRDSYLTSDARFVPHRARLFAAPVCLPLDLVLALAPLGEADEVRYGIDWSPTREYVVNSVHRVEAHPDSMTQEPAIFADLTLSTQPSVDDIGGSASWVFDRETTVNGLLYWFDLELLPGEWISNAPGALPGSWRQLFLPIDPPLVVQAGEELTAGIKPERLRDGAPGWLAWRAAVAGLEFTGHEFASTPASFGDLYLESSDSVPSLREKGMIEARVLGLVDGKRSVSEIAACLREEYGRLSREEAEQLVFGALQGNTQRPKLGDVV